MNQPSRIHLFQGYGVELEYMIVDRETLAVKPIADELLKHKLGAYESDYENGMVTWSNELVMHVIEIKSTRPEHNFNALENAFAENVKEINGILAQWNAMLMPTAAHPFMNPMTESKIWPHESNDVYDLYNKIFDCRGHGWSNLQSTHLNLPFYDDEEFAKLHAAVRLVLPLLPALCASSPVIDAKPTGTLDSRLTYYKTNQARIPSITGKVIPEAVFSKRNYLNTIYEKIKADIAPYDPEHILNPIWVNSRGAIARFDRGSIEIRVMDVQECPAADLAIVALVTETVKALANGKFLDHDSQLKWKTEMLATILDQCAQRAHDTIVDNRDYLSVFGINQPSAMAGEIWKHIFDRLVKQGNGALEKWKPELGIIFTEGTLAGRILKRLGETPPRDAIMTTYRQLADCLSQNKMFTF